MDFYFHPPVCIELSFGMDFNFTDDSNAHRVQAFMQLYHNSSTLLSYYVLMIIF